MTAKLLLSIFLAAALATGHAYAQAPAQTSAKKGAPEQTGHSVGAAPAEQQIQPPPAAAQKFGDWVYECSAPGSAKTTCGLSQIIYRKKGGERKMTAYVLVNEHENKTYLILYMPFGIAVQNDVYLSVGAGPRTAGRVETCLQAGCRVSYTLDEDGVRQFRQGTNATVVFDPVGGASIAYDLSLIGFSQGYKTLTDSRS